MFMTLTVKLSHNTKKDFQQTVFANVYKMASVIRYQAIPLIG